MRQVKIFSAKLISRNEREVLIELNNFLTPTSFLEFLINAENLTVFFHKGRFL